ncbi:hypothetical protein ACFL1M_04555 [Patescibacteria group bacterium]
MKLTTKNYYANIYIDKAKKLGISHEVLHPNGLIRLFLKNKECLFHRAVPQINSALTAELCRHKHLTSFLLKKNKLPTPTQTSVTKFSYLDKREFSTPAVIKPASGIAGKDVFVNITKKTEVRDITKKLLEKHSRIVIESFEHGQDYRFLVFDRQVIGIVKRLPPTIIGDGKSTVKKLILNLPSSNRISIDESLKNTLSNNNTSLKEVLHKNAKVQVRSNSNYSTGGIAETIDNTEIHPKLLTLAIKASDSVYARLSGVDILIKNPKKPTKNNATIIEVNHNPGSKMHYNPDIGKIQDVATIILKRIFQL